MLRELNELSSMIVKAAMSVHSELGPGLMESAYKGCMIVELRKMGIQVRTEVPVPVIYHGQKITEDGFRLDLLVEDKIVVELKSVEKVQPLHQKQLLTYLRLSKKPLGLLINFNELLIKDGIHRLINAPRSGSDLKDFPAENLSNQVEEFFSVSSSGTSERKR